MSTDDQTDPRGAPRNRPDHVDALASTVISVLRERQAVTSDGLRQFVLDHLVRAILAGGVFRSEELLEQLRGYRLSLDTLIDDYVPAAARVLGEQWVSDQIGFSDVTIATLRLQSFLSDASTMIRLDMNADRDCMHNLIVVPQNEHHFLGAYVVGAQLRRMGCEVAMSFDEDHTTLGARLREDVPDLVLITCGRRETLETVAETVQVIRQTLPAGPVIAVGGAVALDKNELKDLTGVDIVTNVAAEAVAFAGEYIRAQKSP